jgi:hypothetical protein
LEPRHDPKTCKRLAEVDFPTAEVSRHAAREVDTVTRAMATCVGCNVVLPPEDDSNHERGLRAFRKAAYAAPPSRFNQHTVVGPRYDDATQKEIDTEEF